MSLCPCGCGHERDPAKCAGHSKRTGKPCDTYPVPGSTVCRFHGAGRNTPAGKKARERLENQAAQAAVAAYGLPREVDPHTALLEELWHTAGHVAWLRDRVQGLDEDGMYGPVGGGEHAEPRQEPHVWIRLYQEERKHLASVARDCIKAGIEERRVKLAEQQAQLIVQYTRALLADLGIDPGTEQARVAMRKHLTLVAGSAS